jgi:hypothetical protein
MNACFLLHSTQEEKDRAREEWFARRRERQAAREKQAKRDVEAKAFRKEWWGVPEGEWEAWRREEIRRQDERFAKGERVGGWRPGGERKEGN